MEALIVTLDGPAGSGKSSVARRLAKRLGVEFLDTGAMYRGIAALCIERGVDSDNNEQAIGDLASVTEIRFDWQTDPPRLLVNGADYTDRLRESDVTAWASKVAAVGQVRHVLVAAQQAIGLEHPRLVTEGRDQGSVVFPDAQAKFYMDASPRIRAKRRVGQLREAGKEADEDTILKQIEERDHRDANRKDGPLLKPDGADVIDTSDLTLEQVIDLLESRVRERVNADAGGAS